MGLVKAACKHVVEIDPWRQFHQHLQAHFLHKRFSPKSFCHSQNITREKLREALSYEKCALKMLMKLTPGKRFQLTSFL
jgi:hypothetical protein